MIDDKSKIVHCVNCGTTFNLEPVQNKSNAPINPQYIYFPKRSKNKGVLYLFIGVLLLCAAVVAYVLLTNGENEPTGDKNVVLNDSVRVEQAAKDELAEQHRVQDSLQNVVDSLARVVEKEREEMKKETVVRTVNEVARYDRSKAKRLKVIKVEYDHSLAPQAGNTYEAKNLCDGNLRTTWAVNLDNESIYDCDMLYGPIFTIYCKKLSHIIIHNGYCKNAQSFKNNTRAAKIKFYRPADYNGYDYTLFYGTLRDISTPQRLDIPLNIEGNNNIKKIQMNFEDRFGGGYYYGEKWNDLCVSEVEFWGFE